MRWTYVTVRVGTADCQGQLRPRTRGISFPHRLSSAHGTARGIREYLKEQGRLVGAPVPDRRQTACTFTMTMNGAAFFRIMPIPADEAGIAIQDRGTVCLPEENQTLHMAIQPQEIALTEGFPFEVVTETFGHALPPARGEQPWRSRRGMGMDRGCFQAKDFRVFNRLARLKVVSKNRKCVLIPVCGGWLGKMS